MPRAPPDRVEVLRIELGPFERARLDAFIAAETATKVLGTAEGVLETVLRALSDNSFALLLVMWFGLYGITIVPPSEGEDLNSWYQVAWQALADASAVREAEGFAETAEAGVHFYLSWLNPLGLYNRIKGAI